MMACPGDENKRHRFQLDTSPGYAGFRRTLAHFILIQIERAKLGGYMPGAEIKNTQSTIKNKHQYIDKISSIFVILFLIIISYITIALFYRASFKIPIMYNEGWNAGLIKNFMLNGKLYYAPYDLVVNNYPPLSFFIVRSFMLFTHDAVFSGRFVSAISFMISGFMMYKISHHELSKRLAAILSALLFIGYTDINYDLYIASDDPQMISIAFSLIGLYMATLGNKKLFFDIFSEIIFAVSIYTKHNNIALPLSVGIWKLIYNRKEFLIFSISGIISSLILMILFTTLLGENFLIGLFSPRHYSFSRALNLMLTYSSSMTLIIALSILPIALFRITKFYSLVFIFIILSFFIGTFELGGDGTGVNAYFELLIASSLGCAVFVSHLFDDGCKFHNLRALVILYMILGVLITPGMNKQKSVFNFKSWNRQINDKENVTKKIIEVIQKSNGLAICETNIYCYWAGKSFYIDRFNFEQKILLGILKNNILLYGLRDAAYPVIQLDNESDVNSLLLKVDDKNNFSNQLDAKELLTKNYIKKTFSGTDVVIYQKKSPI